MKISTGARLVWEMAAHESKLARVEQIEPGQFFCALLKFAQLEDDSLGKLADGDAARLENLVTERDRVKERFHQRGLPLTPARRRLRQLCEGDHEPHDGVVHRSQRSKALFLQAAGLAAGGIMGAPDLLEACLKTPTAPIEQVIQEVDDLRRPSKRKPRPAPAPKPPAEGSRPDRFVRELAPRVEAGDLAVPAVNAPQVQVLAGALQPAEREPVLLVCEPGVPLEAIAAGAAQGLAGKVALLELNLGALIQDMPAGDIQGDMVHSRLSDADPGIDPLRRFLAGDGNAYFVDGTDLPDAVLKPLLGVLRSRASEGSVGLALAVGVEAYQVLIRPDPAGERDWRVIWLHDLHDGDLPQAL
jgi:hypothetical protein